MVVEPGGLLIGSRNGSMFSQLYDDPSLACALVHQLTWQEWEDPDRPALFHSLAPLYSAAHRKIHILNQCAYAPAPWNCNLHIGPWLLSR